MTESRLPDHWVAPRLLGLTTHMLKAAQDYAEDYAIAYGRERFKDVRPQWVSVTERMPDLGVEVLVYSKQPWEEAPSIKLDTWDEQHEAPISFSSATIQIGPGWYQHDEFESVTHWMPLPEPPKA